MRGDFFKFPSTPHLAVLSKVEIRGDKVMTESARDEFLRHELIVEEKIDGANLGLSFDSHGNIRAQNRGAYLPLSETGQWKKLATWLTPRADILFDNLTDRYIIFGEWCYARHSIFYNRLPDWFLGFDIYDKLSSQFLSSTRRDDFCKKMHIIQTPVIARGRFILSELVKLLTQSKLADQPAEGLYLRIDHGEWLSQRAKLVRPEFIQAVIQHWSHATIKPNSLQGRDNPINTG